MLRIEFVFRNFTKAYSVPGYNPVKEGVDNLRQDGLDTDEVFDVILKGESVIGFFRRGLEAQEREINELREAMKDIPAERIFISPGRNEPSKVYEKVKQCDCFVYMRPLIGPDKHELIVVDIKDWLDNWKCA